jgi:hypothetical protein
VINKDRAKSKFFTEERRPLYLHSFIKVAAVVYKIVTN